MVNQLALIIEDDPSVAEVIALTLQLDDFITEVLDDGVEAVTRLHQVAPTLVILDLNLPNISSQAILNQILADKRLVGTQIIIVSGDLARIQKLGDLGYDVLAKPFSLSDLRQLVASQSH